MRPLRRGPGDRAVRSRIEIRLAGKLPAHEAHGWMPLVIVERQQPENPDGRDGLGRVENPGELVHDLVGFFSATELRAKNSDGIAGFLRKMALRMSLGGGRPDHGAHQLHGSAGAAALEWPFDTPVD